MASTPPQHPATPGPRELRAQSVHRLQVGLFGLAAMLLLVGLANIIMDHAQTSADPATAEAAAAAGARDPLADLGVAPGAEPSAPADPAK